ncbi:MAG TPA: hypothetical protein VG345_02365 [Bryobacteraceae bacterium]|jgi:hypothetical protein|nr:hypothetical protein [Bryobacteraceae bacterium]
MVWHHVIPYWTLRDCWNTLASHQRNNAKAKVALHILMRLIGFEHEVAKHMMQAMSEGRLPIDLQGKIEVAVAYPVWDVVEGPKNRTDDPGELFDEFFAGLSASEEVRHRRLKDIFLGMVAFNEATAAIEHIKDEVFNGVANQMSVVERSLRSCSQLIRFRESIWQKVEIRDQPKLSAAVPQWKKRKVVKPGAPT